MTRRTTPTYLSALAGALLLLAGAVTVAAQQATIPDTPQITDVNPPSAARGSSVEVSLAGQRLDGTRGLMCRYSPFPDLVAPTDRGIKVDLLGSTEGQVRAKLTLPADVPPGLHELRAQTAHGITSPQYFYVSQYPQVGEQEPNNAPGQANRIALPATVAGAIEAGEDQDTFAFTARQGEYLVFEVEGFKRYAPAQDPQNGVVYLDSFLVLRDASGRELAYDDDSARLDARLAYQFKTDGTHYVTIRDNQYRGGGDFKYRLDVGKKPVITAIYPPGGQKGTRMVATVYGYNLDGNGAVEARRSVELSETAGPQEFRLSTGEGVSNALPVVSDAVPDTPETEPNNRVEDGNQVVLPVTCSGKFDSFNDVDAFRFQGQAGQRIVCEIAASRYGSKVDSFLTLRTRGGGLVARDDDGGGMPDARIEATLPESDEYCIFVRNALKTGFGPQYFYRVTLRSLQPRFGVVLRQQGVNRQGQPVMVPVDSITVPQGGSTDFEVSLRRVEGQGGDVALSLNVPPQFRGMKLEQVIKAPRNPAGNPTGPDRVAPDPAVKNGANESTVRITAPPELAPGTYLTLYLKMAGNAAGQPYVVNRPLWLTVAPK